MAEFIKDYYDNRELSWLKFNQRVLEEARDESVPLFERLRFAAIFCSNLDEFFMIRVGSLNDQTLLKKESRDNKTDLTSREQLYLISKKVASLMKLRDEAYAEIHKGLKKYGIRHADITSLSQKDKDYMEEYFLKEILPLLSPMVIDKRHPVPFLKNKEIYVGAELRRKDSTKKNSIIGILPCTHTGVFDRLIFLPDDGTGSIRFVLMESLIKFFVAYVFPNYDILSTFNFRITRNADIDVNEALYDHDVDFRDVMEELLKKRKKLTPVRAEFSRCEEELRQKVLSMLNLPVDDRFVYDCHTPLDMSFISELEAVVPKHPELFYNELSPQPSFMIAENESMLKQIQKRDILLSYPYESFRHFIRLLQEAAQDPRVVSIKITLYRVARDSQIIDALIKAAENGKDVLALVELRARFDEENNIGWSKRLEEAGVNVIYGLEEMKVHSKLLLITRKSGNTIQYFTQIGTGNYNERTSKLYTDLTLLTSDMEIGTDASVVFNALSVGNTVESVNQLWVAPRCLKSRAVQMIDNEITYKENGYIALKLNSLTDKDIIDKLVEANRAGVKVELLIRGISCLVTGIPGVTDNITIRSIVGRFLEHSRIYIFGKDERRKVFISSADFMTRNTERRVEVAAPIRDKALADRIVNEFNLMMQDNVKAREQQQDGTYIKVSDLRQSDGPKLDVQIELYRQAYERAAVMRNKNEQKKRPVSTLFKRLFQR